MTASPRGRPVGRRPQLGSPIIPINCTGAYLRHRVAAERAYLARRRIMWWHRAVIALVLCVFYLVIGRDLIALAAAKKETAKMEIEHDARQLREDLKRIPGTVENAGNAAPAMPAALSESGGAAAQLDALAPQPLGNCSPAK